MFNVDNCTWRRVVTFGSEGTEAGNFCRPWGVAITRYSNNWSLVYLIAVADRSNNRVQLFKFDALTKQVTFLHMFGDGPGARHGQFDRPAGIVFNSELEQIIVADKDNHRVQVFDLLGSYLYKFGERGSKCGQFCYPWDIDVCKTTHNIIVSDTRNRRVQMFNSLGRYITHFNQPLDSPRGVVYLAPQQIVVSDFNKHRLVMIMQGDERQVTSSTSSNSTASDSNGTTSNYLNNNNNNNNYSQKYTSITTQSKAIARTQIITSPPLHESKFIGFGEGSSWGEFLRPQGATTYGSTVFCSDSRNNRVACWNKDTQSFSYISKDVVDLDRPAGLAAIDNYIVIVDFGNNRIHICQFVMFMDGNYTWQRVVTFGSEGSDEGKFCRPWGVAITRYSDNCAQMYLIAVADRSNNRVQLFKFDAIEKQVTFLHTFGDGPGARHGQFDRPAGIVFNSDLEQIIVADKDNHRVQVFDLLGTYLYKFGERGSKCGQFCYPWDIDVCKTTHNIIVSDTRNRRVQIFNSLGRYIAHFNQPLDSPRGVVFLTPHQIVVSDFNKHRLVLILQNDDKQVTSSTSLNSSNSNSNVTDYLNNNNHYNKFSNIIGTTTTQSNKAITRTQIITSPPLHESKFIGFGEGSSWGEFLRPQGATTYGSTVFCSDSRNNRVACWNKDTQSFSYISKDVVDLDRPAGLAAIDNYIVIVDFGNNRIHICQYTITGMQAF